MLKLIIYIEVDTAVDASI